MSKMIFAFLVVLVSSMATANSADSAPSIAQCVQPLEEKGYRINAMQKVGQFYEFEAEKNGQAWQVKTNPDCTMAGSKSI